MVSLILKYMKTKYLSIIFLGMIIVTASILRLWRLGSVPPGLTPDEAALGYNAYSILKTGRDEYGTILPIIFKSFGDYKPGLYIYTAVPTVLVFGLTEFATRLPSALAGVVAVCLIYLIIKEIWKNEKLALLGSFLLAINPWHIYFSRGAWEINLSLTLTLAGIYFFYKSLKINKYLIVSVFFFSLSLLAYQGAKLSTGIVVFILLVLYLKDITKFDRKIIFGSFLAGFVVALPVIISIFSGQIGRLTVLSLFSYKRPEKYISDFLNQGGEKIGDLSYYLFHSEKLDYLRGILTRYFNHFSARFLFFEGDWQNLRHAAPNMGMFLVFDLVLMFTGFVVLARKKMVRESLFVGLWLFLAPLPAILTRDQVHAVRSYNLVIPFVLLMAFGLNQLVTRYKKVIFLFFVFYLFNYIYFLDAYFVHLPKHNSLYWEYGYKQAVQKVSSIQNSYKVIKFEQSYNQPYIYFLFFQKYDPVKYQIQSSLSENKHGDVGLVEKLDNIHFVQIDWPRDKGEKGTLFIANPNVIPFDDSKDPNKYKTIDEIKYLNGQTAFRIVEVLK